MSQKDAYLWMFILCLVTVFSIGAMKWLGLNEEVAVPAAGGLTAVVMFGCAAYRRRKNL